MYDVYVDTAVYLDIVDVVQSVGTWFNVQSLIAILDANDVADLAAHTSNAQQPFYKVLIGCG